MSVTVDFMNPRTGEMKPVSLGFNWKLFLSFALLGIVGHFALQDISGFLLLFLDVVYFVLVLWAGEKANEKIGKHYLNKGWTFAHPDQEPARLARICWRLANLNTEAMVDAAEEKGIQEKAAQIMKRSKRIVGLFWVSPIILLPIAYGIAVGIGGKDTDINGLPKCDSASVEDTLKKAIAENALSKIVDLHILSFEEVSYVKHPNAQDMQTFCKANVLTNAGKQPIFYHISKTANGDYYVQTDTPQALEDNTEIAHAASAVEDENSANGKPVYYTLPELQVETSGANAVLLKTTLILEIPDSKASLEEIESNLPHIIDVVRNHIHQLSAADLADKEGIQHLRTDLKGAINEVVGRAIVHDVLFKQLLVE